MDGNHNRWIEDFLLQGAILGASGDELWLGWGACDWRADPPAGRPAFFAADFFLKSGQPWLHLEHCMAVRSNRLIAALAPFVRTLPPPRWQSFEQASFAGIFDDLMAEIRAGRMAKGVPVIFDSMQASIGPAERAAMIDSILRTTRGTPLAIYGFWEPGRGMLGASPELLFEKTAADTLHTMALAGTQPSAAPDDLLLASAKDRWEHGLVVEDIVRSLAVFGNVDVQATAVLRLPNVSHLYTPIGVRLERNFSFVDLVHCLHATPAVGGVPRAAAWRWLERQQDSFDRERFGAPFGAVWSEAQARCVVAIRGIQWTAAQVRMGAGCGVVAQSQARLEWEELQLKLLSIRQVMGL